MGPPSRSSLRSPSNRTLSGLTTQWLTDVHSGMAGIWLHNAFSAWTLGPETVSSRVAAPSVPSPSEDFERQLSDSPYQGGSGSSPK